MTYMIAKSVIAAGGLAAFVAIAVGVLSALGFTDQRLFEVVAIVAVLSQAPAWLYVRLYQAQARSVAAATEAFQLGVQYGATRRRVALAGDEAA